MSIKNCLITIFGIALVASYQPQVIAEFTMHRDYEYETPLPQTGKVTIRLPIQDLPSAKLFESCPKKSYLEEFGESTHYLVMICRDQKNDLKKYWLQKTKKTGRILRLTAQDQPRSQPSLWKSGDYEVMLYKDGRGQGNAYLESYNMKTQKGRGEALLYYYSKFYLKQDANN
ncbi:MAG: hypothetical protein WCO45_07810 [Pseudanabaena sp. ELA607]